ncbi:choline dehydrogenase [Penicillium sp. CMV-2018d]|nr:choline dehydrogenase [Penicillium sp. CMV-2018d]
MPSRFTAAGAFLAGFATLAGAICPIGSSFGIPGKNAAFDYIVVDRSTTTQMTGQLVGEKLYDLPARYQRVVSEMGRSGGRLELHVRPYATYFERSICFTPPNEELRFTNSSPLYDVSVMGDCQGPLSISYSNYAFSFASWATKGLRALGIQPIDGFLSDSLLASRT